MTEHTRRLAAYWAEALGGSSSYSDDFGDETFVVRVHSGNGAHEEMDRRAIVCFDLALADAGLAVDDRLGQVPHDCFAWATTTTMALCPESAEDVPDGLGVPRWSWDGLVAEAVPGGDDATSRSRMLTSSLTSSSTSARASSLTGPRPASQPKPEPDQFAVDAARNPTRVAPREPKDQAPGSALRRFARRIGLVHIWPMERSG